MKRSTSQYEELHYNINVRCIGGWPSPTLCMSCYGEIKWASTRKLKKKKKKNLCKCQNVTLPYYFQLILSAWLNGIGSALRNVSTQEFVPQDHRYTVCLIGQILAACAQPFVMFAPTKLAALWFPSNQRATANMMASMGNFI